MKQTTRLNPGLAAVSAVFAVAAIAGCRGPSSDTANTTPVVIETSLVVVTSVVEVTRPVPASATVVPTVTTAPIATPPPQPAPAAEDDEEGVEVAPPQRPVEDVGAGADDTIDRMIDRVNQYFATVQAGDYEEAFLMLYNQPPFDEYTDYWAEKVESFSYSVVGCEGDNVAGSCTYEIYVNYSDMASPDYAGKCFGERTRIYLDGIEGGWALGAQERLADLSC